VRGSLRAMKASAPAGPPPGASQWRVGDLRIDLRYRRVIRPDREIELPQRMFDLLLVFLSEPETLHTRSALFDRVWPGVIVEDANLSQSVWMLRKALGEERKHWIRTVTKSGYVFEPPTRVEGVDATPVGPSPIDGPPIEAMQVGGNSIDSPPAARASDTTTGKRIAAESANGTIPHAHSAAIANRLLRPRMLLAALCAVAMMGLTGSAGIERRHEARIRTGPATLTVAVLQADDASGNGSQHWPVDLLDDWLSTRLDLLPETVRLSREQLIAETPATPTHLIVLTMETVAYQPLFYQIADVF
jgi:DNA-binding winged helix-turn-helix (wHTH) protein